MNITPTERTIREYALTLTDADAAELSNDPYSFADRLRDALLPHLPQAAPKRKPSAASQLKLNGNGNGHKRGPKGAKLAKVNCPDCGKPVAAKFLPLHRARKHAPVAASASSPA